MLASILPASPRIRPGRAKQPAVSLEPIRIKKSMACERPAIAIGAQLNDNNSYS
jgi:hypothetical protein